MQDQYKNLTPRRKAMLEMRQQGQTLEAIGEKFGISRERVRQILRKLDLETSCPGQDQKPAATENI
jgi:DNA-directed RNA polymerase sigma subunit (sigma70/sigma32)